MTIRWAEKPKQSATLDHNKPTSQREYAFWGSTDKLAIQLAVMGAAPLFDAGLDPTTGANITLFRGAAKIEEGKGGGGVWDVVVPYESSTSTVELNFTLGVQSVKIQQSLSEVSSYSCLQAISEGTTEAVAAASAAANDAEIAVNQISMAAAAATVAAAAAVTAANVAGVNGTVKGFVLSAASSTTATVADATGCVASVANAAEATQAVAADGANGNLASALTDAANAVAYANAAPAFATQAITDGGAATTAAASATAAAIGGNAQTLAAAAAASAAATAAATVQGDLNAAVTDAATAAAKANAVVAALQGDQAPGGNGVPDFKGAIGVNGDTVEGCDIEVGKVEFSITKRWSMATIAGSYFATIADMTDRSVVNNAPFTFIWMGQTLIFNTGCLRFRGASVKWTSQNEVEITYHFAYARSIVASDNFKIGGSGVITRQGWQYLWVFYKASTNAGQVTMVPQSVHVNQVYPLDDFGKLELS